MKLQKRILTAFCIVILAFVLCSCGKPEQKLYGTWETMIDMAPTVEESLGSDFKDFHAPFELKLRITFSDDGTYKVFLDRESSVDTINAWVDSVTDYAVDMTYKQMEDMGYDKKSTDELFKSTYNDTVENYMKEMINENLDVDEIIDSASQSGVYKATKDKLYLDETEIKSNVYDIYKVEGVTLTLDAPTEEAAEEAAALMDGFEYPFILTKISE